MTFHERIRCVGGVMVLRGLMPIYRYADCGGDSKDSGKNTRCPPMGMIDIGGTVEEVQRGR